MNKRKVSPKGTNLKLAYLGEFLNIPKLYAKQKQAFFNNKRYAIVEGATKSGKTLGAMIWILAEFMPKSLISEVKSIGMLESARKTKKETTEEAEPEEEKILEYWWIAPTYDVTKIAYRRIKQEIMKRSLFKNNIIKANEHKLILTCHLNGEVRRLCFKTADKPDHLYGEDVQACIIDEASRVKEESWFAIRTTLTATKGRIRIIGNVAGTNNWFYHLARKAENMGKAEDSLPVKSKKASPNLQNMNYCKLTAYDAVREKLIDIAEIEDARQHMPDYIFRELYMAEANINYSNPFCISAIEECSLRQGFDDMKTIIYGIDLAKYRDYTVIVGMNKAGDVTFIERFQKPWQETIAFIRKTTENTKTIIDSTGIGDAILEQLQRNHDGENYIGYRFDKSSKQKLLEQLAISLEQRAISFPHDSIIHRELKGFEFKYSDQGQITYGASSGNTDDAVIALALCNWGLTRTVTSTSSYNYNWV